MKKIIRVGLDFDGVVAYNPFRIVRAPISLVKRNLLGIKKLSFIYPRRKWQQIIWTILHESSVYPAKGVDYLRILVQDKAIEAHIITARYSFLDNHLYKWLDKYRLRKLFKTINLNKNDEQPHLFKEKLIKKYDLDIFVEDNLDIVKYLHGKGKTKIYWIYNILDRNYPHPKKFPYLGKALEDILNRSKIKVQRSKSSSK